MDDVTCSEPGCSDKPWARGLCHNDYNFHYTRGTLPPLILPTPAERFWRQVDKDGPIPEHAPRLGQCWLWTGFCCKQGYGRFRPTSKPSDPKVLAHRFAYELVVGPIPDGLELDHLCRNTSCVNPSHAEPVTAQVNTKRRSAAMEPKTHCPQNHEYDEENTRYTKDGSRDCRACDRDYQRARYAAKRKASPDRPETPSD